MTIASLLKLFNIGLLSLATANNSLVSLYNPTVVIYDLGSFLNDGFTNAFIYAEKDGERIKVERVVKQ